MKLFNFNRVLCLSPHPDDVEYSMSGMVNVYPDTHFDILCMSMGGENDPTSHLDRFDEVRLFWKKMGSKNVTLYFEHEFINNHNEPSWIDLIEKKYLGDSECILLCSSHDNHFEHRIVNSIGVPLTRKKKVSIIEYRSPSTDKQWIPNFFVEISSNLLRKKIDSLQSFTTQVDSLYFHPKNIPLFHTDFYSVKRGIQYVESYKIIQLYSS